jgi:hypothetical protein
MGVLLEKTKFVKKVAGGLDIQVSGGTTTGPTGYTMIRVQVDGIAGYDEDVIALVVEDDSDFARETPIILGTGVTNRMINVVRETEMDNMTETWQRAMLSLKLCARAVRIDERPAKTDDGPMLPRDTICLESAVHLEPFETQTVYGLLREKVEENSYVVIGEMVQDRHRKLPMGLQIMTSGHELKPGLRAVGVILRNNTNVNINLKRGVAVAWMTTTSRPLCDEPDRPEEECNQPSRLSAQERQQLLIEKLDLTGLAAWPAKEARAARDMLMGMHEAFALEPGELGCTSIIEHEINLDNEVPFKERYRKLAAPMVQEVRQALQDMLASGAIVPSDSPWSNAVVMVRKKDGSLRFCIDFRRLNARTKKDGYPLPRINEALEALFGDAFFSGLDLVSGFWQAKMAQASKKYTAFTVGDLGFFECERMPFGLCNAPATFQRLMQQVLGELAPYVVMVYLDDLLVHSKTRMEHVSHLGKVLERLREENLKCKPSKCQLFRESATCLGHEVSAAGIAPSQEKLRAVAQMAPPKTYTDIRGVIGLVNHYRRFIKDFSKIAAPLFDHLSGEGSGKKRQAVTLSEKALEAFELLKKKCLGHEILALPDYNKSFELETDASGLGLGAVLSQRQEDKKVRPVSYGSRSLTPSEANYHSTKQEFLALKWAITVPFHDYLMFRHFEVKTDNNPLTYIMTTNNLDACGHRWVAALANYDFSISYLKGKDNGAADALSRYTNFLDAVAVKAILDGASVGAPNRAEVFGESVQKLAAETEAPLFARSARLRVAVSVTDWNAAQRLDPALECVARWLEKKVVDQREKRATPGLRIFMEDDIYNTPEGRAFVSEKKRLILHDGKVYRHFEREGKDDSYQFIVPVAQRKNALNGCHRDAGHQGQYRTVSLLRDRFWWPKMQEDANAMVRGCTRCITFDHKQDKAPLLPIIVSMPLEMLHVDFAEREIPLKKGERLKKNEKLKTSSVLVFTDHFTRFTMAYAVPDQKAKTVAKFLWEKVICVLGAPAKLMSDQGKQFESTLIAELCSLHGIRKLRTTPYHPAGNGQVERAHQTITKMIGKLEIEEKPDWPTLLPSLTHAYNCTRSAITGYSPHYLMFGRRPRMPVDLIFPTLPQTSDFREVDAYVAEIHTNLQASLRSVEELNQKEADRQKRSYDRRAHAVSLEAGDQVLVKVGSIKGKHKVHDRWESTQYDVEGPVADGVPVYVVRHPSSGDKKTLHRNRLFLVNPIGGTEVTARTAMNAQVAEEERGANPGEPGEKGPAEADENGASEEEDVVPAGRSDDARSGDTPPGSAQGLLDRIRKMELGVICDGKYLTKKFLSLVRDDDSPTIDKG